MFVWHSNSMNDVKIGGWSDLATASAGERIEAAEYSDRTMQFSGDFSGGASISMRGSCMEDPDPDTPTDWFTLRAAHDGGDNGVIGKYITNYRRRRR